MNATGFLGSIRCIVKLYESVLKQICRQYGLSLIEVQIISFLHNNPGRDTAGDIVELRMLSKGNVSRAVEELIQKSLLLRKPDIQDRRKIHLILLPEAKPITDEIERCKRKFQEEIFKGFSGQEREQYEALNKRIMENTKNIAKGEKSHE